MADMPGRVWWITVPIETCAAACTIFRALGSIWFAPRRTLAAIAARDGIFQHQNIQKLHWFIQGESDGWR